MEKCLRNGRHFYLRWTIYDGQLIDDLVKQSRLVVVQAMQDGPHECLANESAAIGDAIFLTETIQNALLPLVE